MGERSAMGFILNLQSSIRMGKVSIRNHAIVCGLALSSCLLSLLAICTFNSRYLTNAYLNPYPDAQDYLKLGENLRSHGVLSRSSNLEPDSLRTPAYPMIIAVLDANKQPWLLYGLQTLLFVGAAIVLYQTVANGLGHYSALVASVLMSTDLILVKMCFEAMTEMTFLFAYLLFLLVLRWPLTPFEEVPNMQRCIVAGIILAFSILIRPTLMFFAPIFALATMSTVSWRENSKRFLSCTGPIVLTFVSVAIVMPWVIRNYATNSIAKLSNVDTHNMVYFVGAGPYQLRHGISRLEAQSMISEKYSIPSYYTLQNPHKDPRTIRELEDMAEAVKWDIVFDDPARLLLSSAIGICKGLFSHATPSIGNILGIDWKPPGVGGLLNLDSRAWHQLFSNHPILVAVFFWQIAHSSILWCFSALGLLSLIRNKYLQRRLLAILLILFFGMLMITPFGMDAVYRSRLVAIPAMYVLAALGFSRAFRPMTTFKFENDN